MVWRDGAVDIFVAGNTITMAPATLGLLALIMVIVVGLSLAFVMGMIVTLRDWRRT